MRVYGEGGWFGALIIAAASRTLHQDTEKAQVLGHGTTAHQLWF